MKKQASTYEKSPSSSRDFLLMWRTLGNFYDGMFPQETHT